MTARRVDANQAEIITALRAVGAFVFDTHELGRGFPDIVVGYRGVWYLLEIKSPGGRLTEDERRFRDAAAHHGLTVAVVYNVDEALDIIGADRDAA